MGLEKAKLSGDSLLYATDEETLKSSSLLAHLKALKEKIRFVIVRCHYFPISNTWFGVPTIVFS